MSWFDQGSIYPIVVKFNLIFDSFSCATKGNAISEYFNPLVPQLLLESVSQLGISVTPGNEHR